MEKARAWIADLQPFLGFKADAIPVRTQAAEAAISELLAVEQPLIDRICDGVYWRLPSPVHSLYGSRRAINDLAVLSAILPSGCGLSGYSALHQLGWTTQVPVRHTICVSEPGIEIPSIDGCDTAAVYRSNPRRQELNWHETTVLEAMLVW